tara:strand:+ start:334 stop:864 length:531 start_codon:yes stop_codon:yes gene_type:complete
MGEWMEARPKIPEGLIERISMALEDMDAPFIQNLSGALALEWLEEGDSRLGVTRFECDHNEIFRRRRLGVPSGPVTIGINRILEGDEKLFQHTLAHELLHAAGLLDHDGSHAEIVKRVAPSPKLKDSPVLRSMREEVLSSLPERQWICGSCGHSWERRRVTKPDRCPKCARPFKSA